MTDRHLSKKHIDIANEVFKEDVVGDRHREIVEADGLCERDWYKNKASGAPIVRG